MACCRLRPAVHCLSGCGLLRVMLLLLASLLFIWGQPVTPVSSPLLGQDPFGPEIDEEEDGELEEDLAREEDTLQAIDRGIEWLLDQIAEQQVGQEKDRGIGQVALETYALVVAGLSVEHPTIRQNFKFLHEQIPTAEYTYGTACYIFALDAAIAQQETDFLIANPKASWLGIVNHPSVGKRYRGDLKIAVNMLLFAQNQTGGWRYKSTASGYDNSNVQFAVLALGVGAKRGVRIKHGYWRKILDHFLNLQEDLGPVVDGRLTLHEGNTRDRVKLLKKKSEGDDVADDGEGGEHPKGHSTGVEKRLVGPQPDPIIGTETLQLRSRGWPYIEDRVATWNMTCAGLSSLLLVRSNLKGKLKKRERDALDRAIWDGYGWVMKHWQVPAHYYGLYSLEKVADLGHVFLFEGQDWYQQISERLLQLESRDGGWPSGSGTGENRRVTTSFALLVLNRATSLLTDNPASQIVIVTGAHTEEVEGELDSDWAYLPSKGTYIHLPKLLRAIRLRPNPPLVRLLDDVVDGYDVNARPELVPYLAPLLQVAQHKASRQLLQKYLRRITELPRSKPEVFLKWHEQWREVVRTGKEQDAGGLPQLLALHADRKLTVPLRVAVIHALVQCGASRHVGKLVSDLGHGDVRVRTAAYSGLGALFIDPPPYFGPSAPPTERETSIASIRAWLKEQTR